MYIKEDGTIYKVTTTKTEINLEALKQEVEDLKAMKEPTDEELIEADRMMHPYYTDKDRIEVFEEKIAEIENDILPVIKEK